MYFTLLYILIFLIHFSIHQCIPFFLHLFIHSFIWSFVRSFSFSFLALYRYSFISHTYKYCCYVTAPMMLVLEYAPYGDVLGYLRKSRGVEDQFYCSPECCQQEVTSYDLLSFAQQIASGMSFLASKKVCVCLNARKCLRCIYSSSNVNGNFP